MSAATPSVVAPKRGGSEKARGDRVLECFATSLAHLEPHIEALKVRANAWAQGDLESLRAGANRTNECMAQLMATLRDGSLAQGTSAQETLERLRAQPDVAQKELKDNWIAAAEAALARNSSAFAVLSIGAALSDSGFLAALCEKGYAVVAP